MRVVDWLIQTLFIQEVGDRICSWLVAFIDGRRKEREDQSSPTEARPSVYGYPQ